MAAVIAVQTKLWAPGVGGVFAFRDFARKTSRIAYFEIR